MENKLPTTKDYIFSAIGNAYFSGLEIEDLYRAAQITELLEGEDFGSDFDKVISIFIRTAGEEGEG